MQPTTTTDITVDSTPQRLPYATPTLEELSSTATSGKSVNGPENIQNPSGS